MALVAAAPAEDLDDWQVVPGYLQPAAVEATLTGILEPLAACVTGSPAPPEGPVAIHATVDIDSSGAVSGAELTLEPTLEGLHSCAVTAACGLRFEAHDEPFQRWSFDVAARGGEAYLLPSIARIERPRTPLFLYLEQTMDPEASAWLASVMGTPTVTPEPLSPLPPCGVADEPAAPMAPSEPAPAPPQLPSDP